MLAAPHDVGRRVVGVAAGMVLAGLAVAAFVVDLPYRLWSGRQLAGNWGVIWYFTLQHLRYTIVAVVGGALLALPVSYLAVRRPRTYPVLLGVANAIYAIPSIALFVVLGTRFGYTNDTPVIVAMTLYTLVILVRNNVESVRAVPEPTRRAADGMGYRPLGRFVAVELPLALPGIVAGLRLATVSTVSLISVASLIGRGGLGRLFSDGRIRHIVVEIWAGVLGIVALALLLDALLMAIAWAITPWRAAERGGRRRRRRGLRQARVATGDPPAAAAQVRATTGTARIGSRAAPTIARGGGR